MRLDFNYIIVDDDYAISRNRRRVTKLKNTIDNKLKSKGFNPSANIYKNITDFKKGIDNSAITRYDLYLSDNNLGNAVGAEENPHQNDGIELYFELRNKFLCDFVLYTGSAQEEIVEKLKQKLDKTKDPNLFSRFTFVTRSSDPNANWQEPIIQLIDHIISKREEMNNFRGLYAQLTSKIHKKIDTLLSSKNRFVKSIEALDKQRQKYNLSENNIGMLHEIREIRNGLMHEDERRCPQTNRLHLVYKKSGQECKIFIDNLESYRKEIKEIYEKIMDLRNEPS